MRKFTPYIIAIVALVVGFAVGTGFMLRMHTFLMWRESSTSTSVEVNLAVATLRSIRSGNTNEAIERLEGQLDGAVINLGGICRECPRPETEWFPFEALARARDYRVEFPRRTASTNVDSAVSRALTVTDKTKKP